MLLARGDTVIALDRDEDALAALSKELGGPVKGMAQGRLHTIVADVADAKDMEEAATLVAGVYGGRAHALVACAGVIRPGSLVEQDAEDLALVMNVNVMGTVFTTKVTPA